MVPPVRVPESGVKVKPVLEFVLVSMRLNL
jgi:hypothetical protein